MPRIEQFCHDGATPRCPVSWWTQAVGSRQLDVLYRLLIQLQRGKDIYDIDRRKTIPEINKGEDDIKTPMNSPLNITVVNDGLLWESPVPYTFDGSLGLNAKGVVLRALDQVRLKSCIDFKPLNGDRDYIKVIKGDGCWSYVGKVFLSGQQLSIGERCDTNDIVEHEFLHALGFKHEQSRFDRDDHVIINFTNVIKGRERNFQKVDQVSFTTHGTQYDYWSVMHYGPYAFSNGNGPTIITKDPAYMDIIGHTLAMSDTDVLELNVLYKCESNIAFQFQCDFSDDKACPVTHCSNSPLRWEKVSEVIGGPTSDHTSLPSGNPDELSTSSEMSQFMHVSTVVGQLGDSAWLETKRVTPKRACTLKCLQFYYFHSNSESSSLNIWIREFEDDSDFIGKRRLVEKIYGSSTTHWQIKYVQLYTSKSFQVLFEVQKRGLHQTGGISIDDINLSELQCPHTTIQIDNFQEELLNSNPRDIIYSPTYTYSSKGYRYSLGVYLNNPYVGILIQLVSGKYDDELEWPVPDHQVTFQIIDQSPNIQNSMSFERSITSDLSRVNGNGAYRWGNPKDHGTFFIDDNNETIYYGPNIGSYMHVKDLYRQSLLKGGSAVFNIFFEDIRMLNDIDEIPCPPEYPQKYDEQDTDPCLPKTTAEPPHTSHTTPDKWTTTIPQSTSFSPNKLSSPVLILLALWMLFI